MTRLLMLLGVAAVAGAMYVAGASGSQQTKFAPESQVVALQKRVTALTKLVSKTVKPEADISATYILTCLSSVSGSTLTVHAMPVSQRGNTSSGYLFGNSVSSTPTTALDINTASPTDVLQEFDPSCLSGALNHRAVRSGVSHLRLGG